jgi:hypothetical protein
MSKWDQLDTYLKQLQRRVRLGALLRGAALVTAAALTTTLVLVLITNAFAFSHGSLTSARVALFLALALAVGFGLALPLYALNRRRVAGKAEVAFPQFQQRLVTFAEREPGVREPFMELLAADTLELARGATPARLVPDTKLAMSLAVGLGALGLLVWMILAGPGYLGYGAARLWGRSSYGSTPLYEIRVSPGDAAVRRNASQIVTAQIIGLQATQVRLYARYQSASKWEQATMQPQPGASGFQFVFAGLPEGVEYYVEAGALQSRHYNLRVVDLPSIKQIRVTYRFPAWTGLPNAVEEHGGDLRAVEGTEARLEVFTDRPLHDGVLVLDNKQELALNGGEGNLYKGTIGIEKDGMYHVAAVDQGQRIRLSDDFFIEARTANAPDVRITRPGRDYRSSPIEEVTVSVKAEDDYGLNDVSLHYSVNGGPEQTVNMLKQKGAKEADASTTIELENFKLVPGDVVSLYAKAKNPRLESRTDIFFIQAEPFEREYSQSQMAGGAGGFQGGEQYEISQREKEIIAATWKQQGEKKASQQEAAENGKFLSQVQAKLRDQALSLAGRLERRELAEENEEFSDFQKDMNAAAEAMSPAAEKLQRQRWHDAIPDEQKALQHLLRAEATFRRIEVAFGSRSGGGSGGAAGRDLESLFDLELDTEKNQYEAGQTAPRGGDQRAQEIDQALKKLDELARRQQELAEQQHSNTSQSFQQRWQQEMLRREAEQLQRQMDQLARSNQQGSSASSSQTGANGSQGSGDQRVRQAIDRLRQANEDMRRAASPQPSEADARRAADRLREATNLLQGMRQQGASGRLDALAREAERLASEERDQANRMRTAGGGSDHKGAANPSAQEQSDAKLQEQAKLAADRQRMADDLSRLKKEMQGAMGELGSSERSAASKLREALGDLERSELQSRLQKSAGSIRKGVDPDSNSPSLDRNSNDPVIAAGLQRLSEQLRQAQQALTNQQNPEEALDRVEQLRSQLENLARNLEQRGDRPGQQAQGGERTPGGSVSSGFQSGPPGGPRVWRGGVDAGGYIEPPGVERPPSPDSSASIERALQEAMRELNGLRQELRGEPAPLADVQELIRELQRLGPGRFPGNPALVEQLRTQVLTSVDKLELQLRRDLDEKEPGQIRSGDSLQVPSGYKDAVAEYFRRLSQSH